MLPSTICLVMLAFMTCVLNGYLRSWGSHLTVVVKARARHLFAASLPAWKVRLNIYTRLVRPEWGCRLFVFCNSGQSAWFLWHCRCGIGTLFFFGRRWYVSAIWLKRLGLVRTTPPSFANYAVQNVSTQWNKVGHRGRIKYERLKLMLSHALMKASAEWNLLYICEHTRIWVGRVHFARTHHVSLPVFCQTSGSKAWMSHSYCRELQLNIFVEHHIFCCILLDASVFAAGSLSFLPQASANKVLWEAFARSIWWMNDWPASETNCQAFNYMKPHYDAKGHCWNITRSS